MSFQLSLGLSLLPLHESPPHNMASVGAAVNLSITVLGGVVMTTLWLQRLPLGS